MQSSGLSATTTRATRRQSVSKLAAAASNGMPATPRCRRQVSGASLELRVHVRLEWGLEERPAASSCSNATTTHRTALAS